MSAEAPLAAPSGAGTGRWHQRRGVLIGAAAVVVVAIAVVSDLPTTASRGAQIATANAFIAEVNADLSPCDYALHQAYGIRSDQLDGTMTAADATQVPGLLRDDQLACSYAGPEVTDLTNIESPGTAANRPLSQMLATATQWATNDALTAIDDIQSLLAHPTSATDARALAFDTLQLRLDRSIARSSVRAADGILHATLTQVALGDESLPTAPR